MLFGWYAHFEFIVLFVRAARFVTMSLSKDEFDNAWVHLHLHYIFLVIVSHKTDLTLKTTWKLKEEVS